MNKGMNKANYEGKKSKMAVNVRPYSVDAPLQASVLARYRNVGPVSHAITNVSQFHLSFNPLRATASQHKTQNSNIASS